MSSDSPKDHRISPPSVPEIISRRYEVLEQLGRGAMGTVFKVRHTVLGRICAIKVLPRHLALDPEMVARFHREARILATLDHPNIVRILDVDGDEASNMHYLVMEFIDGRTLKEHLAQRRVLPVAEALSIVEGMALGLAYAHHHDPPIVHRDVKPSNVMIEERTRRIVLMDFGIAKQVDDLEMTRVGSAMGTLKYSSPEQMRQEPLDARADVYSLGMVLYEAISGTHLFADMAETEVIGTVLVDKAEFRLDLPAETPADVAELAAKAIAKSRAERYANASEFLQAVRGCLDELQAERTRVAVPPAANLATVRVHEPRPTLDPSTVEVHPVDPSSSHVDTEGEPDEGRTVVLPPPAGDHPGTASGPAASREVGDTPASQHRLAHAAPPPSVPEDAAKSGSGARAAPLAPETRRGGAPPEAPGEHPARGMSETERASTRSRTLRPWPVLGIAGVAIGLAIGVAALVLTGLSGDDEAPRQPRRSAVPRPTPAIARQGDAPTRPSGAPGSAGVASSVPAGSDGGQDALASPEPSPAVTRAPEPTATPAIAEVPGLSEVTSLVRYTDKPTIDLSVPLLAPAAASLDGRPLPTPVAGVAKAKLTGLPVGESQYVLRLDPEPPGTTPQEIPISVVHFPRWEMRKMSSRPGEAYSVAISRDGARVVAGTRGNAAMVFDAASGEKRATLTGHKDWVNDVAFSPDGATILTGSKDRTLKLWDAASGAEQRTLVGHKGWVNTVAISPDGRRALSGSDDQSAKLWDLTTGEEVRTLKGHKDWVFGVAFSPDGGVAATASRDLTVKLWSVESGEELGTLKGHRDWVNAVAFSPDGKRIASASDDQTVKIWSVEGAALEQTLTGHRGWVVGLAFSPDGSRLISAGRDQTVRLWDLASGKELRSFQGHRGIVPDVAFAPDGASAFSAGSDQTIRQWWTRLERDAAPTP